MTNLQKKRLRLCHNAINNRHLIEPHQIVYNCTIISLSKSIEYPRILYSNYNNNNLFIIIHDVARE